MRIRRGTGVTVSLIARSRALVAELEALVDGSRSLVRRSLALCPHRRTIGGGSDAALITMMITGATLCLDCIAKKTGVPVPEVEAMLTGIAKTLKLSAAPGRCDACLGQTTVFCLDRAIPPSN
jgi:hypothetical protein